MKKTNLLLFAALLAFSACSKKNDSGCISRVTPEAHVTAAQQAAAAKLFQMNNINTTNLQLVGPVVSDTVVTNGQANITSTIYTIPLVNGLPFFFGTTLVYTFKNGILINQSGSAPGVASTNVSPNLTLTDLRQLFATEVKSHGYTNQNPLDSCMTAEFGYYTFPTEYNDNATTAIATAPVKAWLVRFKNTGFPQAIFNDSNSALISFDTGASANQTKL